jgi:hypothetical protein
MSFFPRFITSTNIDFAGGEISLLNKGLIYNLSYKPNDCIRTLAVEAETANFSPPKADPATLSVGVTINFNSLYQSHSQCLTHNTLNENKLLIQIKKYTRVTNLKFPEHTKQLY